MNIENKFENVCCQLIKEDVFKDADECEVTSCTRTVKYLCFCQVLVFLSSICVFVKFLCFVKYLCFCQVLVFLSSTCVFVIWGCNRSLARNFSVANKDLHYSPNL